MTLHALREVGFKSVKKQRIAANEGLRWKKRVFDEYYRNVKIEISGLTNSKLQDAFMNRLEKLKREIKASEKIKWAWGVNYLIQAQK